MVRHRTAFAEQAARGAAGGRPARAERDILSAALRRALGGSARALRAANHLLQPLPPLDQRRVWDRIIDALTEAYDGHIQMIDGTSVRVHHSAATLKKSGPDRCQGRSRGGLTTKIHALTNRAGLPIRLAITPGQTHDIQPAHAMLEGIGSGAMLLADKAYDANAIRSQLRQQGVFANIQARAGRKEPVVFSPHLYKARNVIERFFNKLTFFGASPPVMPVLGLDPRNKLGSTFLAMIKLAAIRLYLRAYDSTA